MCFFAFTLCELTFWSQQWKKQHELLKEKKKKDNPATYSEHFPVSASASSMENVIGFSNMQQKHITLICWIRFD